MLINKINRGKQRVFTLCHFCKICSLLIIALLVNVAISEANADMAGTAGEKMAAGVNNLAATDGNNPAEVNNYSAGNDNIKSHIANAPSAPPILAKVVIKGNQRIEKQTILSYANLNIGNKFDKYELDRAIKNLFATGFFADLKLTPIPTSTNKITLVIDVTENPIISKIAFEGNKRIKDEELAAEITLAPRSAFTRTGVQNDVQRILQLYKRSGRYSAKVEPKVITLDNNRVNLVFEIDEGPETYVRQINFIGNKMFSDHTLRDVIRTSESTWWNPFSSSEKYDPDRLLFDKELLRRFYVSQGFADFQVKSTIAELSPNGDGFYITFTLEEGDIYRFGDVAVKTSVAGSGKINLQDSITFASGEIYNADEIENTIENIVEKMGDNGFAFVDVKPHFKRNPHDNTIDVSFRVNQGPKVYVERINITGNSRTLDEVIRREFRLAEGDPYSTSKLARSEQRINNLGFFEKVKVSQEPGSAPDQTVINVDVQEQSTGEITLGAGYSTTDGPLADFGIRESNLLGRGQELRLRTMIASQRQQFDIGFTEPYFLGREIAAGFDIFKTRQDFSRESAFDRATTGGALRLGYTLSEHLKHNIFYRFEEIDITDVDSNASRFIRDQEGVNTSSLIGHALTWDKRNNRFEPTDGWYFRIQQEFAGLGGDSRFIRHEMRAAKYWPIAPQWTFKLATTGGHVLGLGRNIRINERFFVGGRRLRGFENSGIGPRDRLTEDALGGNIFYTATAETTFPLGLPDDLGFLGAAFVDVGSLWDLDVTDDDIVASDSARVSVGVGLSWKSPFGPIRIDFSQAIVKEDEDQTQMFNFNFGTRF